MSIGFKNVTSYANDHISNVLEINLRYFLQDGFMRMGAVIPQRQTRLQPDQSNNIVDLSVWNAGIQSWSWKKADGKTGTILTPATVTVNGNIDNNVIIDYNRGQVTFDRELSASDIVIATHYTNRVGVHTVLELNRRPMIQLGGDRGEVGEDFSVFQMLSVSEVVRPPFIILEAFPTSSAQPYALGTGALWENTRIQMNVMTETIGELSKIRDILRAQSYWSLVLFDTNKATVDGILPIDPVTGDINRNPNVLQYPDLLRQYRLGTVYWGNVSARTFKTDKEDVHWGIIMLTIKSISNPRA